MATVPGFWDVGPHDPLPVEETWTEFITLVGGKRIADLLPDSPDFNNADFLFEDLEFVVELKEIETEFLKKEAAQRQFEGLVDRLMMEDPTWRPVPYGGEARLPAWFGKEFIRLARPPLLRVLKKGNRQLRDTKAFFGIDKPSGILILVNDGFTGMAPDLVQALACDALLHAYSSIDCFLYATVNRYVEVAGSNVPSLMWSPSYSDRAEDQLVSFIDDLGRKWGNFLERNIGPFTSKLEIGDRSVFSMAKAIVLPGEERS
jgi:hypothetical protein